MGSPGAARRWAVRLALAALLAVAALVAHDLAKVPSTPTYEPVIRATALDERPVPPAADGDPTPCSGRPVRFLVVGWDGASWDLLLPLLDRGLLPNLAGLLANGASGNLYSFEPSLSPALWTTVATGVTPASHGIAGFERRKHPLLRRIERVTHLGRIRRTLFTNADRRSPALWNLFSDAGRSVLVVGYHNTFPAEEVRGAMVSSYLAQAQMAGMLDADRAAGDPFRRSLVHPPERTEDVLALERSVHADLASALARFTDLGPQRLAAIRDLDWKLGPAADEREYFLRQAYVLDTFHAAAARELGARLHPDLTMVHFQALDWAGHHFLGTADASYARTVTEFHVYLDELLGGLLDARGEDGAVLLLSDHGFDADAPDGPSHDAAPPGILVLEGPGVRRGARIDGATLYDVFPTIVAAAGLPLADDLPGRPLAEAFCPGALDAPRVPTYETAGRYVPRIAAPADLERGIEEQLRSLGYIR